MKKLLEFIFFGTLVSFNPKSRELPKSWLNDLWEDLDQKK